MWHSVHNQPRELGESWASWPTVQQGLITTKPLLTGTLRTRIAGLDNGTGVSVRSRKSFRTATPAFYPTDVKWRSAGTALELAVVAESHLPIAALAQFEPVVCEVVTVLPPGPTDTPVLAKFGVDAKTISIKPI